AQFVIPNVAKRRRDPLTMDLVASHEYGTQGSSPVRGFGVIRDFASLLLRHQIALPTPTCRSESREPFTPPSSRPDARAWRQGPAAPRARTAPDPCLTMPSGRARS